MSFLGREVLDPEVAFNTSDDNNFKYGRGVFYMYNPSHLPFDMDDEYLDKHVYGPERGEIHGFASHSFKHFKEFTSQQSVDKIIRSVIDKLRELRYDKVLVQKKLKGGGLNALEEMSIDHPDFKHYVMNGLDWIQDRTMKGWNIFDDEREVLDVAFDLHEIYADQLGVFLDESRDAEVISDANFPNKSDLFDHLLDCYMNRKSVIFEIERENGKIYQTVYNVGDTRYSSYNIQKRTRGTFMRMEKPIKRRTIWRNLIRWAPISRIDEDGIPVMNGNQVTDDFTNFQEICQDARFNRVGTKFELGDDKKQTPVHPEFGYKLRRKGDKPTGAIIPHSEDLTMESHLRRAIRMLIMEEVHNPDMVEKLNVLIDAAAENEATWKLGRWDRKNPYADPPQNDWNQIHELCHAFDWIDNPPKELKMWTIVDADEGEILTQSSHQTYDQAIQWANEHGMEPADELGNRNPDGPARDGNQLFFIYSE